ncbi:MAG: hypothetical protein VKP57_07975 [Candidatus Sericytochromatia bacterium]|nr:hypothetical protein [Candidatus Sericytochromatia bacterium]
MRYGYLPMNPVEAMRLHRRQGYLEVDIRRIYDMRVLVEDLAAREGTMTLGDTLAVRSVFEHLERCHALPASRG